MSQFVGNWKCHSSENMDEFLKVMGAPWIARKMAGNARPKLEVTVNGEHHIFKSIGFRTIVTEFKVDEEFEDVTMDGQKYKSIVRREGEKLVELAKLKDFDVKTTREIQGDELVITLQVNEVVAVRRFRRE